MASISKERRNKDGSRYYIISVSRGYGKTPYQLRVIRDEVMKGYSDRAVQQKLKKLAEEFAAKCEAGEVMTRPEKKAKEEQDRIREEQEKIAEQQKIEQEKAEQAKLKTVRQFGEETYMKEKKRECQLNTVVSYQNMLDKHIYPLIGDMVLCKVTSEHCEMCIETYQDEGKGAKHSSVMKLYAVLCGLFDLAFRKEKIDISPMLRIKRPAPRADEKVKDDSEKVFSDKELAHILNCAENEPLKWKCFINILVYTGMRRGEVAGLRWEDINMITGEVTVRNNLQYNVENGVYEKMPKSGKARILFLNPAVLPMLRNLRAEQILSSYVFTQDGSPDPIFPQTPISILTKFGTKYGIQNIYAHKFRHSFLTSMQANGADPMIISLVAGHAIQGVTGIYLHPDKELIRKAQQLSWDAIDALRKEKNDAVEQEA